MTRVIRSVRNVKLAGALLAVVAPWLAPSASAQKTARAEVLGKRIMCMCGGCNDAAGLCKHSGGSFAGPCGTARAMLEELDERVARNESDDLTLQAFVQEYGPTVLLEPPANGFNWAAWVMPAVVPIVGFGLVWLVVSRWRKRALLAPAVAVSPEMLARARKEAGGDIDD